MIPDLPIDDLLALAWKARESAYVIGPTKVGSALVTTTGEFFAACNVEHRARCHDVHAEVNAITSMVAAGLQEIAAIAITAERDFFTPCGGCLDWIMQFGGPECSVIQQSTIAGKYTIYRAKDLMPFYPR